MELGFLIGELSTDILSTNYTDLHELFFLSTEGH